MNSQGHGTASKTARPGPKTKEPSPTCALGRVEPIPGDQVRLATGMEQRRRQSSPSVLTILTASPGFDGSCRSAQLAGDGGTVCGAMLLRFAVAQPHVADQAARCCSRSAREREYFPVAGNAFHRPSPDGCERSAGTEGKVPYGARSMNRAGCGFSRDARCQMDGHAAQVFSAPLALPGMNASSQCKTVRLGIAGQSLSAFDRKRWPSKGKHIAIAGMLDDPSTQSRRMAASACVQLFKNHPPSVVTRGAQGGG